MNKKLIASGIALTLCLTAIAPVYKNLSFNREILEPTTLQSNGSASSQGRTLSEIDILRAEILDQKNDPSANSSAVEAASTTVAAVQSKPTAAEVKKTTTTTTVKKSTSASTKKVTATSYSKPRTATKATTYRKSSTTSRGETTAVSSSKASAIIATAKKYIGTPYVWGGETPSGFDCSGFSQYVFGRNGISLPRVSSDQYQTGIAVSKANLRAGDLVFFTTYKPGPSHLGIYIGNGQFIHASSSKGVTISSISSTYYSSRYVGARRVIN